MSDYQNKGNIDAKDVVTAEKGDNLSPRNLHIRLRIVEWVALATVLLNLLHWYIAGAKDENLQHQVDVVKEQTGVR